jgi:hypothetical protein
MRITYSECMSVVFVIQHAQIMRRIILNSLVSLAPLHFSIFYNKRHDFRESVF